MEMNLVNEFVEVFLVACAKINERLHCLIGVGRDVLALGVLEHVEHVVGKGGEVSDAVVDVGRSVDADKWFVEDSEEITEKLERHGLGHGKFWM